MKCWELDPTRSAFHRYEVMFFQNARRMRPFDPRRLANQAVCLNVCFGAFETKELGKQQLQVSLLFLFSPFLSLFSFSLFMFSLYAFILSLSFSLFSFFLSHN